jgi:hypothetical protein
MRRRSKVSGARAKKRRLQAAKASRSNVPKAALRSQSTPSGMEAEVARLTRERDEALERQTATSEVLQVISSSPTDLEPVFATTLEKAVRIAEAAFGNIYRLEGETGHLVATYNTPKHLLRNAEPHRIGVPHREVLLTVCSQPNQLFT